MSKRVKARIRSRVALVALAAGVGLGLALTWVGFEALAVARLGDRAPTSASRLYARPPVLHLGMRPDRAAVAAHLRRLGYRAAPDHRVGAGEYRLDSRRWTIGSRVFRHHGLVEPSVTWTVRLGFGGRIGRLQDGEGGSVQQITLEPELLGLMPAGGQRDLRDQLLVPLEQLPSDLVAAVLVIEDQRFYAHRGLDPSRIAGAALTNLRAGRVVQGGSTITQQLARGLFLSRRRTLLRKVREAAMALTLERRYSKREILEAYLNEVYLGQQGAVAIHGVGAAARHYFGKDVAELDLAESALLVGLIRGPSLYSPFRHPEAATARRNLVLERLKQLGAIEEERLAAAASASLTLREPQVERVPSRYFLDYLRGRVAESEAPDLADAGQALFTTLDADLQRAAARAVRDGLAELEARRPELGARGATDPPGGKAIQAALIALDPHSGEILAMIGGRDYAASQFNRAVQARRQPGSAFKPVVTLAALSRHRRRAPQSPTASETSPPFTLATVLEDERLVVETPLGPWRPANYDGRFRGPVTLRDALERSLNVPFARLGMAIGPEGIVETARALGIASPLMPVPSLALGSGELSLFELTRAFGVLAAGGYLAEPQPLLGVLDSHRLGLQRMSHSGEQRFNRVDAYLVTSALQGAVDRGTGRGLRALGFDGAVAAKSGTTNDYRDAWFVGYTPSLAVGVWVGFDDGARIGLPGSRAALPIFARFLNEAVGQTGTTGPYGAGDFPLPAGLHIAEVDPATGLLAGPGCRGQLELFAPGTAPRESCSPWARVAVDRLRGLRRRGGAWLDAQAARLNELLRRLDRRDVRVESGRRGGRNDH